VPRIKTDKKDKQGLADAGLWPRRLRGLVLGSLF
jgi:hypothetical protein